MHWNMERSQFDRADLDGFFVVEGLCDTDLQFGDLVVVVLFGGEVVGHGGYPFRAFSRLCRTLSSKKKARMKRAKFFVWFS